MTSTARLRVHDLQVSFGDTTVLDRLSLSVDPGEFVSILGPSGSGKSTLLSVLTGGMSARAGEVFIDGTRIEHSDPRTFAYMPQRDSLLPWRRVIDNTTLGLEIAGVRRKEARRIAAPLFAEFGIAGTEMRYPSELSGGMRQRAALLRTVVQGKDLLLLDEPLGALDAITRAELQSWIAGMWEKHRWTVVLITHDIREALLLSDRVLVLGGQPARIAHEFRVPRTGPRDHTFLAEPSIAALEGKLLNALLPHTRSERTP
jgi:ABC-type nitrate/sulfonate/bicarbonate transport system ATPase subunit